MDLFIHIMGLVTPISQDCHEASLLSVEPGALKMLIIWFIFTMAGMILVGHCQGFMGRGPWEAKRESRSRIALPGLFCCGLYKTVLGPQGREAGEVPE